MSGPTPKNRLGETNTMKNGMKAKIVRYKSSAEIDIQFEDGTTVYNKTYASFIQGKIGHPNTLHKSKIKNRTGEVNQMANGMKATIISYTSSINIDVEFEDGAIRKGCSYKEFKSGHISHPEHTSDTLAQKRLGEERKMNCGLVAKITKYNNYHDVELTFEDGETVYPVDYGQFSTGSIAHPLYDGTTSLQEASIAYYFNKLGFIKMPRGSLKDIGLGMLELDLYNPDKAIAIEIDGRFHKSEDAVERDINKNKKCHNAGITLYRLRDKELPVLTDGLSLNYVISGDELYNGLIDCGNILKEIICATNMQTPSNDYINFQRDLDSILEFFFDNYLNYKRKDRIGEQIFHNATNQFITIIDYKDYHHITVKFEDGSVAYNKNYGAFKRGEIKHPKHTSTAQKFSRLGESKNMNCGSKATIITYRNSEDIDIEFEDGSIRRGVTYYNFQKGSIKK